MVESASIAIEVVYALPEKQMLLRLSVPRGTRMREAVALSAEVPELIELLREVRALLGDRTAS